MEIATNVLIENIKVITDEYIYINIHHLITVANFSMNSSGAPRDAKPTTWQN